MPHENSHGCHMVVRTEESNEVGATSGWYDDTHSCAAFACLLGLSSCGELACWSTPPSREMNSQQNTVIANCLLKLNGGSIRF